MTRDGIVSSIIVILGIIIAFLTPEIRKAVGLDPYDKTTKEPHNTKNPQKNISFTPIQTEIITMYSIALTVVGFASLTAGATFNEAMGWIVSLIIPIPIGIIIGRFWGGFFSALFTTVVFIVLAGNPNWFMGLMKASLISAVIGGIIGRVCFFMGLKATF